MTMFHVVAHRIAKAMAFVGGIVLIFLVAATCISIAGRSLNSVGNWEPVTTAAPSIANFLQGFSPILGDFELVEMGIAIAIFLFLPWCQLNRAHAAVDIFTTKLFSIRFERVLLLVWEVVLTLIMTLITMQLYAGMRDKMQYGETTFLLQWPIWWPYAVCVGAGGLGVFVGCYAILKRYRDTVSGLPSIEAAPR